MHAVKAVSSLFEVCRVEQGSPMSSQIAEGDAYVCNKYWKASGQLVTPPEIRFASREIASRHLLPERGGVWHTLALRSYRVCHFPPSGITRSQTPLLGPLRKIYGPCQPSRVSLPAEAAYLIPSWRAFG